MHGLAGKHRAKQKKPANLDFQHGGLPRSEPLLNRKPTRAAIFVKLPDQSLCPAGRGLPSMFPSRRPKGYRGLLKLNSCPRPFYEGTYYLGGMGWVMEPFTGTYTAAQQLAAWKIQCRTVNPNYEDALCGHSSQGTSHF